LLPVGLDHEELAAVDVAAFQILDREDVEAGRDRLALVC
jgi:hypothetical protein